MINSFCLNIESRSISVKTCFPSRIIKNYPQILGHVPRLSLFTGIQLVLIIQQISLLFWAQIVGHDDDEEIEEEERNGERGKSRWTLYFRDSIKIL